MKKVKKIEEKIRKIIYWIKSKYPFCRHFILKDRNCPFCNYEERK